MQTVSSEPPKCFLFVRTELSNWVICGLTWLLLGEVRCLKKTLPPLNGTCFSIVTGNDVVSAYKLKKVKKQFCGLPFVDFPFCGGKWQVVWKSSLWGLSDTTETEEGWRNKTFHWLWYKDKENSEKVWTEEEYIVGNVCCSLDWDMLDSVWTRGRQVVTNRHLTLTVL